MQKLSPVQPPVPIPDVVRSLEEMVIEKPAQYNSPQYHNGHLSSSSQVNYVDYNEKALSHLFSFCIVHEMLVFTKYLENTIHI